MTVAARKGIETMYRGVLMRSRTEARWAALFDELEWDWTYEPFDCFGWIPDFNIKFPTGNMLVEVKATDEDFPDAQKKINRAAYDGTVLIVGHDIDGNTCGRIRDWSDGIRQWCVAEFFMCLSCGSPSVLASEGDWKCRACGDGYGNAHVGQFDITSAWTKAGNRVQWKPEVTDDY